MEYSGKSSEMEYSGKSSEMEYSGKSSYTGEAAEVWTFFLYHKTSDIVRDRFIVGNRNRSKCCETVESIQQKMRTKEFE